MNFEKNTAHPKFINYENAREQVISPSASYAE
jgi:hypothetical protein